MTMILKLITIALGVALLIGVAGCGNKGPLTQPDQTQRQSNDY